MSIKLECQLNWNINQIRKSLRLERHSNWNATQIKMSLKSNVNEIKMSLDLECLPIEM